MSIILSIISICLSIIALCSTWKNEHRLDMMEGSIENDKYEDEEHEYY